MIDDPHAGAGLLHAGRSLEEATGCVVLLHGRGATAESILALGNALDRPDCAFLAPQAASVGYGPAWYPHSFLAPLSQNEPWLTSALAVVARVVEHARGTGIPPERLVIAGFSQGACLASEFVARTPKRYGGLVALSGGLIGNGEQQGVDPPADKVFDYDGDLTGLPVFLGCSDRDPHVPVARVHATAEVFRGMGAEVDERIYAGMGHTVNEEELEAFGLILQSSLPAPAG